MNALGWLYGAFRAALLSRTSLLIEILVLRQQLAIYKRDKPRPRIRRRDRLFWVFLSRLWPGWRSALVID
jgi:hypothetical protein